MNGIVNKNLLAGDKCMPQMYLRQPGFTYSASGQFANNKKGIDKFKETVDSIYIYQCKLDKACIQHDNRKTASEKYYVKKHLILLKIRNMLDINVDLLEWFTIFFDKKSSGCAVRRADKFAIKTEIMPNHQLAEELHKLIIKKLEK